MADVTLAAEVLEACRTRRWTLATAESCTGGLIAAALTAVPGSSDVLDRGFVTYSNAAKIELLGVTSACLDAFGAVSTQVAEEMAQGALTRSAVDIAVSVTGIAGPGGSGVKPEGLVCFGLALRTQPTQVREVKFGPVGRSTVRSKSVEFALTWVHETVREAAP